MKIGSIFHKMNGKYFELELNLLLENDKETITENE